jgi:hypothetical protein
MATVARDALPSGERYRYLDGAERGDLAWEWLRRDSEYRRIDGDSNPPADGMVSIVEAAPAQCTARWHCLNLPDSALTWRQAPILWDAGVSPSVLRVVAIRSSIGGGQPLDLNSCGASATLVRGRNCEHVLLRDDNGALRLDIASGTLLEGPVSVLVDMSGIDEIEPVIGALRRFHHLCRNGRFPPDRGSIRQGLRRQVAALRVYDAIVQGASIRDVGVMLFGVYRVRNEWAGEALKSQCRRLIALARAMAAGGYLSLLR